MRMESNAKSGFTPFTTVHHLRRQRRLRTRSCVLCPAQTSPERFETRVPRVHDRTWSGLSFLPNAKTAQIAAWRPSATDRQDSSIQPKTRLVYPFLGGIQRSHP